ncbi:hypothetical protein MSMEI_4865 [Mycolicibacterium smegmatis MC2 155]|jgi:hypothetical protein|uniref:Uncharacterized protein n=2 Tax=Mycolicibacterium smegmatis (strain ATCC 700084 / mc(2)155) TaxID=246196 RepID=I7GEH7_MYCS2|nr:hypothetical protein MSMEI_4865 [Mycolicibacterium smegmatis MC2 155]
MVAADRSTGLPLNGRPDQKSLQVVRMKIKYTLAGLGAAAAVSMGAFGVLGGSGLSGSAQFDEALGPTMGETSTQTGAPTELETSIATPPIEVELPDGYGAAG